MLVTPRRVISLVPSATETLVALGAHVVGCTRFCKQPGIATFGGTKNPDVAKIAEAAPDLVIVDVEENRREDAEALEQAGIELLVTAVRSVTDAVGVVDRLAVAAGVSGPPRISIEASPDRRYGRVLVPIWRRPWMTINGATYGASLLASIGWDTAASSVEPYPTIELDDPHLAPVDLVAVPSEPYSFTEDHVIELRSAFPGVPVVRVDGEDLFWWGIRTAEAQRRLDAALRDIRTA